MSSRVGDGARARVGGASDMRPTRPSSRLATGFAAIILAGGAALAQFIIVPGRAADHPPLYSEGAPVRHLTVTLFKSRTLRIDRPFSTAVVGAPDIADILPMSDRSLYIQGKKVGTTNVSVFDEARRLISVVDLEVTPDTDALLTKIRSSTDSSGIRVSSVHGQVVLSGEARDAVAADRAVSLAKGLSPDNTTIINAMKVAPSQQVMLRVRFLEATRDATRALGVNWFLGNSTGTRGANIGSGAPSIDRRPGISPGGGPAGTVTPGGTPVPAFDSVVQGASVPFIQSTGTLAGIAAQPFGTFLASLVNSSTGSVDVMINALETKGLIRRLAEPDLVALSGDTAAFLAGGEFPVPVVQASTGQIPTISVEYKQFGVQLTFMPTVLTNGIINVRLAPSVSELDFANAIQISGFNIPSLVKREARTTIELRDGQSFAIAGLLQANNVGNINQLPWLGSVPVLGALFRSTGYNQHETDLVVIVTPHLVSPAAPGQRLATPFDERLPANDIDAFLLGQLERKKEYTDYVTAGGGLEGPYGHMIRIEPGSNAPVLKR
jgi:pilus assembly protein CpaC